MFDYTIVLKSYIVLKVSHVTQFCQTCKKTLVGNLSYWIPFIQLTWSIYIKKINDKEQVSFFRPYSSSKVYPKTDDSEIGKDICEAAADVLLVSKKLF